MRRPKRAPREVYRLYEEDEFLDAAPPSEDVGAARPPRALAGTAGRAAAVAMLAGSVGAVGVLLARHTGASTHRRASTARTRAAMTAQIGVSARPRLSLRASTPARGWWRRRPTHVRPRRTLAEARTPLEQARIEPGQREPGDRREPVAVVASTDRPDAEFGFEH
jgi:hypothetical protein